MWKTKGLAVPGQLNLLLESSIPLLHDVIIILSPRIAGRLQWRNLGVGTTEAFATPKILKF